MAGRRGAGATGWLLGGLIVAGLLVGLAVVGLTTPGRAVAPPPAATRTPILIPTLVPDVTAPPPATPAPALTQPPTPNPQPATPSPAPPGAVFGLAWFNKPPADGSTAAQLAACCRYIHLTAPSDFPFRAQLRQAGYTRPINTYMLAYGVEGPGPYKDSTAACAPGYQPFDATLAWAKDDFCREIHRNESWFLHNSKGERIVGDYFGTGHWVYLMNPAEPGWRDWSYARFQLIKETWGYDGVFLDNLDLSLFRAQGEENTSDGLVREYSSDAQWQPVMINWLKGLRARLGTWPIWANYIGGGTDPAAWDPYAPYLDGWLSETFSVRWVADWRSDQEWRDELARAERWLAAGKGLILGGQGNRDDLPRMRFTLASYMLIAQGDQAYYRYSRYDTYYSNLWLYPDFDTARALGAPLGPRQETSPGVWRRPFAQGYVEVDLATHSGRLVLQGP